MDMIEVGFIQSVGVKTMPKLDLTPAMTNEDLESLVKYLGYLAEEQTIKGNTESSSLYKKFQRETEIELYVADSIGLIKQEVKQ
tara:strand:- start:894 stop:1145 length:252 start_codon:yes stop_codon:yes gene_type:complete